jgi:hypothetical protein
LNIPAFYRFISVHISSPQSMKLGTYPLLSLAKARNKTASALRDAELRHDPATEKQEERHALTFRQVALNYIERHAKTQKKSWQEEERVIKKGSHAGVREAACQGHYSERRSCLAGP